MFRALETPDPFVACHRLTLAQLPPPRLRALLRAAGGDPVAALDLREGLTPRQALRVDDAARCPLDPQTLRDAQALDVRAVLHQEPGYPAGLLPYDDAPALLFVRGADLDLRHPIAVVGSRRPTRYGKEQSARFAAAFAAAGCAVVSGGAAGIDTAAHQATLEAGGVTVAVLACGLDVAYPAENRTLFARILAAGGALVSEFPVGTTPEPWRFPTRNRIIAGIARATVVVEAPEQSGALITARNAAEYGREVFVVPGPVDTGRSRGGHRLIQDGAALADAPEDVLAELARQLSLDLIADAKGPVVPAPRPVPELPADEAALWRRLGPDPRLLDDAAEEAGLAPARAGVAATLLEMKGLILRQPGGLFRRTPGFDASV